MQVEEFLPAMKVAKELQKAEHSRMKEREAQEFKEKEEATKIMLEAQEAKVNEATAALLAELDAEERQAAAATAKKKSKKKGNKKKGGGGQQQQAVSAAPVDGAAGRGVGAEECKAGEKRIAPQLSPQMEDGQGQGRQGVLQDVADAAAVAAVSMGNLSLEEENAVGTASSKDEEDLFEEEKHTISSSTALQMD